MPVAGLTIRYLTAGSGPPAVLLHGLIASGKTWDVNLPALAAVRTVYALDLANMGLSGRDRTLDAGLPAEAERVLAFLDALGLERVDLIGQSHGGSIALTLAAEHPQRVRRMVLFAPANPFCQNARGLMRFYLSPPGLAFTQVIPYLPRLAKRLAFRRVYVDPSRITATAFAGYLDSLEAGAIRHALGIVRSWWPDMERLRQNLPVASRTPTLLIWGNRDQVVSLASGQRLAKELSAELKIVSPPATCLSPKNPMSATLRRSSFFAVEPGCCRITRGRHPRLLLLRVFF